MSRVRGFLCILALIVFAFSTGCQKPGPVRYHLSGEVTFEGKPVAGGMVFFTPDFSVQTGGLQGFAAITNGKFDTRLEGNGHSGGPMILRISGYNGVPEGEYSAGRPLFAEYEMKVDLPKGDSVHKIEVPSAAGT